MTSGGCTEFRDELGPFVDGELDGVRMLRASRHIDECDECATALAEIRTIGQVLRDAAPEDPAAELFDGLAGSVVSRAGAEAAQSWRAKFARGCESWHWAIVGAGSIAATFVSTSLLSFILTFGPAPHRGDSLSALATNLGTPAGFFFVYASPAGPYAGLDVVLLQVENGRPVAPRLVNELAATATHRTATEAELVWLLQEVTTYGGRVLSIDQLGPEQRLVAEAVLDELARLRSARRSNVSRTFNVHEMRLVTSVGVSAKRL